MRKVVLISTYELGRQPFGLASPAAWLRRAGAAVTCLDTTVQPLDEAAIAAADLIAFYLPMHTATRLALALLPRIRGLNPRASLCFYGLYAPVNDAYLRSLGAAAILGGEFEAELVRLLERLPEGPQVVQTGPTISLARQRFLVPDRSGMAGLTRYAHLDSGDGLRRTVGATEASRGCKHLCRHCPVVPVYGGRFRIVQRDVVLADIRQQVSAGAAHITFGDPDFWNGVGHAMAVVEAVHAEFPRLTYDVTIKIEHLLQHAEHLPTLRDTGCLFVTSAVESLDDRVLALLEKGHTRADFEAVLCRFRQIGLTLIPTFIPFTPWISPDGYQELLRELARLDLVRSVAPVQLSLRLLIPAGSRLLALSHIRGLVGRFDPARLCYPWRHPDPRMDALQESVQRLVQGVARSGEDREAAFARVWALAQEAGAPGKAFPPDRRGSAREPVPVLSEPWYC